MCISEPDVIKQHGKVRKAVRWPAMISVLVCDNRHGVEYLLIDVLSSSL